MSQLQYVRDIHEFPQCFVWITHELQISDQLGCIQEILNQLEESGLFRGDDAWPFMA